MPSKPIDPAVSLTHVVLLSGQGEQMVDAGRR